jgi:hypothetical protein
MWSVVMKMLILSSIYSGIALADHWPLILEEGRRLKAWVMDSHSARA